MHDFITEFKPDFADDEIDLGELFTALWRGKWLIFSLCCVALMLASRYLRGAERKYTVSMTFKPVIADNFGPTSAQIWLVLAAWRLWPFLWAYCRAYFCSTIKPNNWVCGC